MITLWVSPTVLWPVDHKLYEIAVNVSATDQDGKIFLRAERSGLDEDRIYTITYRARDVAGNTATASAMVTVPHDQRRN